MTFSPFVFRFFDTIYRFIHIFKKIRIMKVIKGLFKDLSISKTLHQNIFYIFFWWCRIIYNILSLETQFFLHIAHYFYWFFKYMFLIMEKTLVFQSKKIKLYFFSVCIYYARYKCSRSSAEDKFLCAWAIANRKESWIVLGIIFFS